VQARTKTLAHLVAVAGHLGCCAGGLLAALLWIRPLTLWLLARGAGTALVIPLGYAHHRAGPYVAPADRIGWLYAARPALVRGHPL
jgi:hypothetical protein